MKKMVVMVWVCALAACSGQVYFEAGPWFRTDIDLSVRGGSSAADEGVAAASPGTRGTTARVDPLSPDDDGTAQVLRTFDDGYVGPSGWGWARTLGYSQYFGYNTKSQYDNAAETLTFIRTLEGMATGERTSTRLTSGPSGWSDSDDLSGAGIQATVGYTLLQQAPFTASAQFRFGWLGGINSSFRGRETWRQQAEWFTFDSTMSREQSYTYVYDTLGAPIPTAPYEMTDPSGIGVMIDDRPESITAGEETIVTADSLVRYRTATAVSRVDLDADMDAYVLALGPRMVYQVAEGLKLLLEGGLTATLLDADLDRTETFAWEDGAVIRQWRASDNHQEWLWGGSLGIGLQVDFTDSFYAVAEAGYDWVKQAEFSIGPDEIQVDLSGWQAGLSLGWLFSGHKGLIPPSANSPE
ncbi:MAG: hypothetical protein EOM10_09840 [Opitutae bacterium]|nr:hypothetical protein [Opitutae bacterium]